MACTGVLRDDDASLYEHACVECMKLDAQSRKVFVKLETLDLSEYKMTESKLKPADPEVKQADPEVKPADLEVKQEEDIKPEETAPAPDYFEDINVKIVDETEESASNSDAIVKAVPKNGSLKLKLRVDPVSKQWQNGTKMEEVGVEEVQIDSRDVGSLLQTVVEEAEKVRESFVEERVAVEMDEDVVPKQEPRTLRKRGPFQCDKCDYKGKRRDRFEDHMKTHSDERPFPCPHCEQCFKTQVSLQHHTNTHLQIKPFKCKQCDAAFTTSGEVIRHRRYKHTKEKPYT